MGRVVAGTAMDRSDSDEQARKRDATAGDAGSGDGDDLTRRIIRLALRVHRHLGPGLLESVYAACLAWEIGQAGLVLEQQVPLALTYGDLRLPCVYRADLVVERRVILEIKAVDHVLPLHAAQLLTYLRLSGCRVGLLLNFNTVMLKDGIRRCVL